MVSGGDRPYSLKPIGFYPAFAGSVYYKKIGRLSDGAKNYKLFRRESEEGRAEYYEDMYGTLAQLINVVSLAMWVPV